MFKGSQSITADSFVKVIKQNVQNQRDAKREARMSCQKEYHTIFQRWRYYDLYTTVFAMIGLFVAIFNHEYEIRSELHSIDKEKYPDPMLHPKNIHLTSFISRIIIGITTLIALVCLCLRHHYKLRWTNKYFKGQSKCHDHGDMNMFYDKIISDTSK